MKTMMKKVLVLFWVVCLAMSMSCIVNASGVEDRSVQVPGSDLIGIEHTKLFTFSSSGLSGLKKSQEIQKSSLPSGSKKIGLSGYMEHTANSSLSGYTMRAGICYVSASTGNLVPLDGAYRNYTSTSASVSFKFNVSTLTNGVKYYAYMKNMSPSYGTVSGSIMVYTTK